MGKGALICIQYAFKKSGLTFPVSNYFSIIKNVESVANNALHSQNSLSKGIIACSRVVFEAITIENRFSISVIIRNPN